MDASDRFKVKTKHPAEFVSKVIGRNSDSVLAARIAREDINLYRELKADAVALGLADSEREHWMAEPQRRAEAKAANDKVITQEEISARQEFSAEYIHTVLHKGPNESGPSLSELVKANGPEWHQRFRTAAKSYGELNSNGPQVVVKDRRPKPAPKPEPIVSTLWLLPDDVCDANNLPRGSRTSRAMHSQLCIEHGIQKLTATQREIAERGAELKRQEAQLEVLKKEAAASDAPAAPFATEEKK